MATCVLVVEQAGPLTTVQDAGRPGHLRHGVTWSGPIDRAAFAAAHRALGNPHNTPAIELSHGGITLRCLEGEVGFALAGGDFAASVDGAAAGGWTTGVLHAGQRLQVRDGAAGNWAVLAFAGALDCPRWLGSAATLALVGLGGGRISAGNRLFIDAGKPPPARPLPRPPQATGPIRVVMGPQAAYFDAAAQVALVTQEFRIAPAFDRMGVVLAGPALVPLSVEMLSAPLLRGAIQVNGAGTATILLADHQTTAGYPRIAAVISADLDRAAQLRPGEALRFAAVSVADAVTAARAAAQAEAQWLTAVAAGQGSLADRLASANLIDGVVDATLSG